MSGLLRLFRGERSLPFTYWICYVGGSAVAIAALYAWLAGTAYLLDYPTAYRFGFYLIIGWVFFVTYVVGAGVVRSALNRRPRGIWAWLAIVVVALAMVNVPLKLFSFWSVDDEETARLMKAQLELMNAGLPKKVNEWTALQRISYDNKVISYHYVIDENTPYNFDPQRVKVADLDFMCKLWKPYFDKGELLSVNYGFLLRENLHAFSLIPSDCPDPNPGAASL